MSLSLGLTGDLEAHEATGAMVPLKGGPSQWVNRAETLFVQGTLGTAKKLGKGVGKALRISGTNDTADAAAAEDDEDDDLSPSSRVIPDLEEVVGAWMKALQSTVSFETKVLEQNSNAELPAGFDIGTISRMLITYHQWYIVCEQQRMKKFLEEITKIPDVFGTVEAGVFSGSALMFKRIKDTMFRISGMCPRNPKQCQEIQAKMYVKVFNNCLLDYNAMLNKGLEVAAAQKNPLEAGMALATTANYCLDLAPQLESKLQNLGADGECLLGSEDLRGRLMRKYILTKHEASMKTVELALGAVEPILAQVKTVDTHVPGGASSFIQDDLAQMFETLNKMFQNLSSDDAIITVLKFVTQVALLRPLLRSPVTLTQTLPVPVNLCV